MAHIDDAIKKLCETAIEGRMAPGCAVGYIRGGKTVVAPFGQLTYEAGAPAVSAETVYDLASITKSIPTSSVILKLAEGGRLSLDDKVASYLPELQNEYRESILIRHLLTFTVSFDVGRSLAAIAREEPEQILERLFAAPVPAPPGERYLYTNAPSLLLGIIAERVTGRALDVLAHEMLFAPLEMTRTTFHPDFPRDEIAPTEVDWRGEVRGQVHDPGAWALTRQGVVPGHAGLFSTASDLLRFGQMLLNGGEFEGHRILAPETIASMHTNQTPQLETQAGLGWEINRPEISGGYVSHEAFGKTGFTGTMIMVDPVKEAVLVVLSNRNYPKPTEWTATRALWRQLCGLVFAG